MNTTADPRCATVVGAGVHRDVRSEGRKDHAGLERRAHARTVGVKEARFTGPELPVVVCSNVVLEENGLLLVRESKPSALGRWSLPGGKLEPGETLQQGAEREALEETGLTVEAGSLLGIYHCLAGTELPDDIVTIVAASSPPSR